MPHLARCGEVPPPWSPSHSASSEEETGLESGSWLAKLLFSPACKGGMLSGMPGPCSSWGGGPVAARASEPTVPAATQFSPASETGRALSDSHTSSSP